MTGWCESCDGPMSDTGRFPVAEASLMERMEYVRYGRNLVVPRIDRSRDFPICTDCNSDYAAWEQEEQ